MSGIDMPSANHLMHSGSLGESRISQARHVSAVTDPRRTWTNVTATAVVIGSGSGSIDMCGLSEASVNNIRYRKPIGTETKDPD
jgi:hypothetical protein